MANENNLIPYSKRSKKEAREDGRKGGKKSGEVRRQRRAMKEQMEMLLSLPFNLKDREGNDIADMLSELGIDKENIDNQMALIISLWKTATNSRSTQQIQAVREIREMVQDEKNVSNTSRIEIINDLPEDDENGTG